MLALEKPPLTLRGPVMGLCLALSLACSGEPPIELTLTPSSLFFSQFKGQSLELWVEAAVEFHEEVEGPVQLVILDSGGILGSSTEITRQSDQWYTALIRTQPGLSAGRHKGTFEIRLCADTGCQEQYGSASLPYDITVLDESEIQQPPLSPWSGAGDWTAFNGDAAHRGHLPVRPDPSRFSKRWTWSASNQSPSIYDWSISPPLSVSADGVAYLRSSSGSTGTRSVLYALKESDGSQVWRSELGANYFSAPALAGGQLYLAALENTQGHLWAIDARTGTPTFKAPVPQGSGSIQVPSQPVVVDQTVYVNFGETTALDAASGAVRWSVPTSGSYAASPAVDSGRLYLYQPNRSSSAPGFTALDKATGATAFTVPSPARPPQGGVSEYRGSAPVLTGTGRALVNHNGGESSSPLDCVDLATRQLAWRLSESSYSSAPVVAGNIVYALNYTRSRLEARSLEDGSLLWHWSPSTAFHSGLYGSVVATDTIVFVAVELGMSNHVYAVDTQKRTAVWSYPRSGQLSLSASGLLYITEKDRVTAINLQ